MKKISILLLVLISFSSYSQKITSKNYYEFFANPKQVKGKKLTTAWVSKFEVATILEEEMKKAGFEWISTFRIVKLNENEYVNSICFSEKSKVGFLYEGSHNAFPNPNGRKIKSMYKEMTGNDYAEKIVKINDDADFVKIKEVPNNFYILKEDPYWYQYTDNSDDDKNLVTKEIILEILRSDIKEIISSFKK
jgi:hypothetical protein